MNLTIITALVSSFYVAISTIILVIVTSNLRDTVNKERLKYLSEKI